jgi:fumarate reductase flavoprotein subunit
MVFDERLHRLMQAFEDYRDAIEARAVRSASDAVALATVTGLPETALQRTMAEVAEMASGVRSCPFGRDFRGKPSLVAPFHAVKVRGAIFHTQGGLVVDGRARVLREDGRAFPNLYAGGGAARGISGPSAWGYMAGNGLLTATTLGRLAGETAAVAIREP